MMGKQLVTLALVAFLAGSASAAKIVDLVPGGDWVTETTALPRNGEITSILGDFDGEGDANDGVMQLPFSTSATLGPASAKQSSTFYGGFQMSQEDKELIKYGKFNVADTDPNDALQLGDNDAGGGREMIAVLVWLEADFLTSGRDIVDDDAMMLRAKNHLFGGIDVQWLVKKDGTYYVSQELQSYNDLKAYNTFVSQSLTTTQWASVDLDANIGSPLGTYEALDLTDIEGVGVYVTGGSRRLFVEGFSADAVPEPTTMALLGLGGLAGLLRRRR